MDICDVDRVTRKTKFVKALRRKGGISHCFYFLEERSICQMELFIERWESVVVGKEKLFTRNGSQLQKACLLRSGPNKGHTTGQAIG